MSDFIELGQSRTALREYNESVVTNSDVDTFSQLTPFSLANARTLMKDGFLNNPRNLVIYCGLSQTMVVGNTIQLLALLFREKQYSPSITPDAQGKDVTGVATWFTTNASHATVSEGLVTAVATGTAEIYAKIGGGFESNHIVITVS